MKRGLLFSDDRDKSVRKSALWWWGGVSPSKALWVCVAAPTCQYSRPTARGQSRPSQTEKVGCSWLSEGRGGDTFEASEVFFFSKGGKVENILISTLLLKST